MIINVNICWAIFYWNEGILLLAVHNVCMYVHCIMFFFYHKLTINPTVTCISAETILMVNVTIIHL